jgi:hypothetical protein
MFGCSSWSEARTAAVNVADWLPACTDSVLGTCTRELLDVKATVAPPTGAGAANWTAQSSAPAISELGVQYSEVMGLRLGATSEIVVARVLPFSVAVTIAVWSIAIVPAVTVKLAAVVPGASATEDGTLSAVVLLDRATVAPLAVETATVQVELASDARLVCAQVSQLRVTGATSEMAAVRVLPFSVAVIVAVWSTVIVPAVAVKLALALPGATRTEAGTVRAKLLADSVTETPLPVAEEEMVTVQVALAPESTLVGVHCRPEMVGSGGVTVTTAVPELAFSPAVTVTA